MIRNSLSLGFLCLRFGQSISISEHPNEVLEERGVERRGRIVFLHCFMFLLVEAVNPSLNSFSGLRPLSFFRCFVLGLSLPESKL
ncbi:hypothetical protein MSP8887_03483 [Marinomonas spartinae]|uniref:Uncharacterized protein n=1 Tax=Marinomonas spartinae TaxID=1792290 RepID=A0A1A8TV29_9GAMM|nr:hypothetical protein MSP8886_04182 [Marinomonas spartinae]SBS38772.1 hypothetical protein MSP8887_03483 [Marinomonas spartinae]